MSKKKVKKLTKRLDTAVSQEMYEDVQWLCKRMGIYPAEFIRGLIARATGEEKRYDNIMSGKE